MNIPSKVRVGSVDYDVIVSDSIILKNNQQCYGHIDWEHHKIEIDNTLQDEQGLSKTFLHELVHGIVHEFKIDFSADEEDIVDKLADGLHQVIRDNLPNDCVTSAKVGDVQLNYSEVTENAIKRIGEELEKTLKHEKENRLIFTLKDVFKLGSFEKIRSYFKKENENIFIKELEVVEEVCNYQETEILYYDGTSYEKTGQLSVPIEKSLKLPICTPIEIVLQIMKISKENDR